jgi:Tol biopolymer transport system component
MRSEVILTAISRQRQAGPARLGRRRALGRFGGATLGAGAVLAGLAETGCLPWEGAGGGAGAGAPPLVFGSEGNITSMTLDGKQRRALTRVSGGALARDPVWSPDGRRIAYGYTPPLPTGRGPGGLLPLPATDVYAMNADGSDARAQIEHGAPGIGFETPVWAPDGNAFYVTYTELVVESSVVRDQIVEVARVPAAGGERQTLAPGGMSPALSPDGKRLAYLSGAAMAQGLVIADADGKGPVALVPEGAMEGLAAPRFSPDGRRLVFSAIAPMAPVPTTTPPPGRGPQAAGPRRALAHGLPMDLFVVDVDGGPPRRLTQLGEDNPAATWSPDGKRLAMLAGGGVYLLNADGSDLRAIDSRGGHGTIDWRR